MKRWAGGVLTYESGIICATEAKNGFLGNGPSIKMCGWRGGGDRRGPLAEKHPGDFGTKNNKETYIFGDFGI